VITSDTPETDAAWACFKGYTEPLQDVKDLSRKLERERDEAREQAQRLRVENNHNWQANEMAEQAFRERDKAHKIAEQAIDDLAWFNETNAQRLRAELDQLKEGAE
jgi:hypothetical protein